MNNVLDREKAGSDQRYFIKYFLLTYNQQPIPC